MRLAWWLLTLTSKVNVWFLSPTRGPSKLTGDPVRKSTHVPCFSMAGQVASAWKRTPYSKYQSFFQGIFGENLILSGTYLLF